MSIDISFFDPTKKRMAPSPFRDFMIVYVYYVGVRDFFIESA